MSDANSLLPCPFCGSRAEIKTGTYTKYVMCLGCEVMGSNLKDEQELIAQWNNRASPVSTGADAKDAARYRWLRNVAGNVGCAPGPMVINADEDANIILIAGTAAPCGDALDQAIDAAMSDEAGKV